MSSIISGGIPTSGQEHSTNRIRTRMSERVARLAASGPAAINGRLAELVHEWSIERVIAAGAATVALAGTGLGSALDRRLLALPVAAGALLLLHSLGVPSPVAAGLRRMGYRTAAEIEEERSSLKVLRGDFHDLLRMSTEEDRAEVSRWEDEGGAGGAGEDAHDRADRHAIDDALRATRPASATGG